MRTRALSTRTGARSRNRSSTSKPRSPDISGFGALGSSRPAQLNGTRPRAMTCGRDVGEEVPHARWPYRSPPPRAGSAALLGSDWPVVSPQSDDRAEHGVTHPTPAGIRRWLVSGQRIPRKPDQPTRPGPVGPCDEQRQRDACLAARRHRHPVRRRVQYREACRLSPRELSDGLRRKSRLSARSERNQ